MPTITLRDQSTAGHPIGPDLTLDFLTEHITVRELLRSRVYQEVQDFNLKQQQDASLPFRGLVQPTDTEATLNGYKLKSPRLLDWKPQFEKACDAFQHNRILLLIDNHQPTTLDEPITLRPQTTVTFLKLTPLVGG